MVKFPTKLEEFLPPQALTKVLDLLSQPQLTNAVRETLQKVGLRDANPVGQVQDAWRQARGWFESVVERVMEQNQASPAAINGTGVLFDARWSGLPGNSVAVQALVASAVSFQDQSQLEQFATRSAATALGAQSALLVSGTAAALSLLARASAFQGGLVLSRTDVLRIPNAADVRAILEAGKNSFADIGAVNGATEEDWRTSVTSSAQSLVRISPNSLELDDDRRQSAAGAARAREVGARVVDVLLDATLDESVAQLGFPLLSSRLSNGSDLVIAPLDGLLGGPAGAVIAGREDVIQSLRHTALASGSLLQGPLLASAAAIFARDAQPDRPRSNLLQMLLTNVENLKERARRLSIQLHNTQRVATAESLERNARLGSSPWHRYHLPTHVVSLVPRDIAPEEFSSELASGKLGSAIWTKPEDGRVIIDLRFVDPADDHKIVETICGV
jgi:seryl-tRNA(Sec) selenium transferase